MDNATLGDLLGRKAALEAIIGRIDVWLLIFGAIVVIGVAGLFLLSVGTRLSSLEGAAGTR